VSVALSGGAGEDIRGGYQLHVHEPGPMDGVQVLSLQESAANSTGIPRLSNFC
jgi:hypothetical protein